MSIISSSQPKDILAQAAKITKLQALLALDLAITVAHNNKQDPTVQLTLQTGRVPVSVFLAASDIDATISSLCATLMDELERDGVSTSNIIADYKKAAENILSNQQRISPIDTPTGT